MKKCENCSKDHDGLFASGRFCCRACSNSFSSREKREEINKKVSLKLKKYTDKDLEKTCPVCSKTFIAKKIKIMCCSRSCGVLFGNMNMSEETKLKISKNRSDRIKRRYDNGDTSIGWQTRSGSSFPEKFFEHALIARNISYKREVRIGKWFADFLVGNLVLEIDGRQHEDRREKDIEKDSFLRDNGYSVTRIKWLSPNSKRNIEKMFNELENFIELTKNAK